MLLGPLALDLLFEWWRRLWRWNRPTAAHVVRFLPNPVTVATAIWTNGQLKRILRRKSESEGQKFLRPLALDLQTERWRRR